MAEVLLIKLSLHQFIGLVYTSVIHCSSLVLAQQR